MSSLKGGSQRINYLQHEHIFTSINSHKCLHAWTSILLNTSTYKGQGGSKNGELEGRRKGRRRRVRLR